MTGPLPDQELPTLDELSHLRAAQRGDMYRITAGRIVINPSAGTTGLKGKKVRGARDLRRNAQKDVVAGLIEQRLLAEGPTRFIITPAGAAVIAADDRRKQLHTELYRERFGAPE